MQINIRIFVRIITYIFRFVNSFGENYFRFLLFFVVRSQNKRNCKILNGIHFEQELMSQEFGNVLLIRALRYFSFVAMPPLI